MVPGWHRDEGILFGTLVATLAVWGISQSINRNIEVLSVREENARLALDDERNRFARDLHDILGHSLTVITVKAELANRLIDVDTDRARAELADLERLSRDALADVRRAVEGYRDLTLPGELARARMALSAAEIDADLPNTTDEVPSDRRELFAWAVREGDHQRDPAQRRPPVHRRARHARGGGPRRRAWCGRDRHRHRQRSDRAARARDGTRRHRGHPVAGARASRSRSWSRSGHPVIRLLLADDQALVRGALSALLGLEPDLEVVAEVSTGDAVVPAVLEHRPDVALLDVEMPGLDGISAAAEVRRVSPATRVLIVTTFGRPGFLRRAMQSGADGFIVKDTPAAQLADAVRRVHQGLRVVDPALAMDSLTIGDSPLTERETDVLRAAADGAAVAVIAARVHLSPGTVRNHLSAAIGKTGAANRSEAVRLATANGWL